VCFDEGILQAYLDGEFPEERQAEISSHLSVCERCRHELGEVRANNDFVAAQMSAFLDEGSRKHVTREEDFSVKSRRFRKTISRYRKVAAAAAVAAVFLVAFSFPQVRSAAAEFLTVFRVEGVQTISINPEDLQNLEAALEEGMGKVDIDNFGRVEVDGKQETVKVSYEEAKETVDFGLKAPVFEGYGNPASWEVLKGYSVNLCLDVDNVNALLEALGSNSVLPESLDGSNFSLQVPTAAAAKYTGGDSVLFLIQARSPSITAPSGADVAAIREALLDIPALPADIKRQLRAVRDWQNTFLVPNVGGSSEEVIVNGTQGVVIASQDSHSLLWQQDGVVYMLTGSGLDKHTVLALGEQVH